MKTYRTSEVFVPGGMPQLTYVARTERNLEAQLAAAKDNLCKLVTITGATKSGKTVLVNRIFPRSNCVWVDGGTIASEDDLWNYILSGIKGSTELTDHETKGADSSFKGELQGEAQIPLFAKAKGTVGTEYKRTRGSTKGRRLSLTPRTAAISQLRSVKCPLIIDDFHYLRREFQGNIIRALKPLIFEGLPIILIAIPHRRYDAVKVERELTGRLLSISIPTWDNPELFEIAKEGFPLLNVDVNQGVMSRLADEAYGSPHLMQEFCKELAKIHNVNETLPEKQDISSVPNTLFSDVAEGTGKVVFDKLAKGPRQRTDRMQRKLKNGESADIYKVTLYALARIRPGLATIEYEQLRAAIREVLSDSLPQAHEVTRVLEKMANIAASDEASIPVLDWDREEQKLHITDPFFAFYLKWGVAQPTTADR
jgi:hypothetical protein